MREDHFSGLFEMSGSICVSDWLVSESNDEREFQETCRQNLAKPGCLHMCVFIWLDSSGKIDWKLALGEERGVERLRLAHDALRGILLNMEKGKPEIPGICESLPWLGLNEKPVPARIPDFAYVAMLTSLANCTGKYGPFSCRICAVLENISTGVLPLIGTGGLRVSTAAGLLDDKMIKVGLVNIMMELNKRVREN